MPDDRRYDEREVGLILQRVTELHEREGDKADARAMTRAEIEHVVTELGISKALVARAMSEVSLPSSRHRPVWYLGGSTDMVLEEIVEGSIDEAAMAQMLDVLRRHLGEPGTLERSSGARIWSTGGQGGRRIHMTLFEHEGRTTVRLEERMHVDAHATVGIATFVGGITGFMMMVPLKALVMKALLLLMMGPLVLTGALLGWLGGRLAWRRLSRAREAVLRSVFPELIGVAHRRLAAAADVDEPDDPG